ncbi:helix-turn-helix domain-containing protein [Micromonospora coerulea]|uniref:helix-turn-helix domain-containing protein n=1 Tax=Micromonospora coerulea TaxID=47856 RepID=UPI0019087428|nr:helix-turn-helix domain-containing protein [Micromonospora veneta]
MSTVSPRTAELCTIALRKVLTLAAPRRNGRPLPEDIVQAFAELDAACSANGTKVDTPVPALGRYECVADAAQRLGITPRAVRKRCAAGTLPARHVGRVWLIEKGA